MNCIPFSLVRVENSKNLQYHCVRIDRRQMYVVIYTYTPQKQPKELTDCEQEPVQPARPEGIRSVRNLVIDRLRVEVSQKINSQVGCRFKSNKNDQPDPTRCEIQYNIIIYYYCGTHGVIAIDSGSTLIPLHALSFSRLRFPIQFKF